MSNEIVPYAVKYDFYLSNTGSTYYDQAMTVGGARHTPTGVLRKPYLTIATGLAALGTPVVCTVLDSSTYDEVVMMNQYTLQAALGQIPTIRTGIGARATRTMVHDGNNGDTIYVGKSGNDTTGNGNYQNPYLTITKAITEITGSKVNINIIDSNIYLEGTLTFPVGTGVIEPCYGKTPTIMARSTVTNMIYLNATNYSVYGITITSNGFGITSGIQCNYPTGNCEFNDNTIFNSIGTTGISVNQRNNATSWAGMVDRNRMTAITTGIYVQTYSARTLAGSIRYNLIYSCGTGMIIGSAGDPSTNTISTNITYNTVFGCSGTGIYFYRGIDQDYTGIFSNNTVKNNALYDLRLNHPITGFPGTITGTFKNSIVGILYAPNYTVTISYSAYITNTGFTLGTGMVTTDPQLVDVASGNYSISAIIPPAPATVSPAYKSDDGGQNMGASPYAMNCGSDNSVVNGFKFTGLNPYSIGNTPIGICGFGSDVILKWCSFSYFGSHAIDIAGSSPRNWTVTNCIISNNATGLYSGFSGTKLYYCDIFLNSVSGVTCNVGTLNVDHCDSNGNGYGFFLTNGVTGVIFGNSITSSNISYGIYSTYTQISAIFCDIDDATVNVLEDTSCYEENPLFISVASSPGFDFRLKSLYGGYSQSSPLFSNASDGTDIGSHQSSTVISSYSWKKFILNFNPKTMQFNMSGKGITVFQNALGQRDSFVLNHKRQFIFSFEDNVSNAELRETISYFSTLVKGRGITLDENQTHFRLHFQPTGFLDSGTSTSGSVTELYIADTSKNWPLNRYRGWHVGIRYLNASSATVDSTTRRISGFSSVPPADYWTGYYIYLDGFYYYITASSSGSCTVLDPDGTLVSGTYADVHIEKYFKIISNTKNVLYVSDPEGDFLKYNPSQLPYYIDFIECKILDENNSFSQSPFLWTREHSKTGFEIQFEEI